MPFVFKLCSRQSGTVALTPSALPHHRSSPRSVWFDVEFFFMARAPRLLGSNRSYFYMWGKMGCALSDDDYGVATVRKVATA